MATTACAAYAYEGARLPPPLLTPARSPPPPRQVPEPPPIDLDDCAFNFKPPVPPPPPPPELLRQSSIFSRHLGLCTEGLGSESSGDVDLDDLINDVDDDNVEDERQFLQCKRRQERDDSDDEPARDRISRRAFPPPISVIGAGRKPWLYLRPHREHGRLVLREVRIPSRELLQARREDGRLKLHFAPPQPEDEEQELVDAHRYDQGQEQADANKGSKRTANGSGF